MKKCPSPLAHALQARVELLATTLRPSTIAHYRITVKLFVTYLEAAFPNVRLPSQLRRDPHILGWLEHIWKRRGRSGRALSANTRAHHVLHVRHLLELLADHRHPPHPALLRSEDVPRPDQVLPRALDPEDDAALQAEFRRRNDLLSNALLLLRLTGMRIGECVDVAPEALRHVGQERWSLHVPLGKLHSERLVPVDAEVRTIIARLLFLRTLPPAAEAAFLLPRPKGRAALLANLRAHLHDCVQASGLSCRVVPHQLRHTFATSMLRAGVSLPALMNLLGHRTANMTMRYLRITQQDLQREFHLARQNPRHLMPLPAALPPSDAGAANAALVLERLGSAIRVLDLYRLQNPDQDSNTLRLLSRRLLRIRTAFNKSASGSNGQK